MNKESSSAPITRCGSIAVIGAPNAGKSTLVNKMMGKEISIVTHKAQTTRDAISGVITRGTKQIILVDTAGLLQTKAKKHRLNRDMVRQSWQQAQDADHILLVIDVIRGINTEKVQGILTSLEQRGLSCVLIFNKIDLIAKPLLLKMVADAQKWSNIKQVFMVSALKGDGVDDIKVFLNESLPVRPFQFSFDQQSNTSRDFQAAEVTRKILLENLHQEIPYRLKVETDQIRQYSKGGYHINQTVKVAREAHRRILLRRGLLQRIAMKSRLELERLWGEKINLFLHAKQVKNFPAMKK